VVLFGKGTRAPMSLGLFGGYPGCNVGYETFRGANLDELPDRLQELHAEETVEQSWGHLELEDGDVQYVRFMGGGGYGDPIDREPEAVARDVALGLVTEAPARDIYGVVFDGARLDADATRRRRLEIRSERLGREVDAGLVGRREVEATGMWMSEYLQRAGDGSTQCTWCGATVAPAGEDWKEHAQRLRAPTSIAGPERGAEEFELIEALCPGCGTMLDVDLAMGEDRPLNDRVESWPEVGP
jgi:N-methylhydantoinase B